eukprot:CAMPEP_0172515626 /NCGR_PEP_ID=MMETSP1066-20121228/269444_1 /TAXON_ID=671091 /ORGANISM="Coscinodiscus wailesii, Strain CCMP2513" /LENGTH=313 /DNA_ID=CAMNT_0013296743 /DNA_START=72 /DNA_END=1013 /DNA_ORIENTATION=+
MTQIFNIAIATIFAREILEASIIIGQYRTVVLRSDDWKDDREKQALRTITMSAFWASLVAVLICVAAAVPLAVFSRDLDERAVMIIEAVSKMVGAVCVLQLSLKIPTWLELYPRKRGIDVGVTLKEIRFNVAWNIWREVAECGAFLIPFFLGDAAIAVPLSAAVGTVISLILGVAIYFGNKKLENKFWLAFFMSAITAALSTGLFVGGCHLLEKVLGETKTVWKIQNDFWSHEKFPMTILKPLGYSSSRTVLQMVSFWAWIALTLGLHYRKYYYAQKRRAEQRSDSCTSSSNSDNNPQVIELASHDHPENTIA